MMDTNAIRKENDETVKLTSHYREGALLEVNRPVITVLNIDRLMEEYAKLGSLESIPLLGLSGYVTKGWTTLISGAPKSGKTELLTKFAQDCLASGRTVLWITEEGIRVIGERLLRRGAEHFTGFRLAIALNSDPREIERLMREATEEIIVLDTVRTLLKIKDENSNSEVALRLAPIIRAANDGNKTLLLVHHLRKGGGEYGEGSAGANAYMSSVDAGLEIRRYSYEADSRKREIHGWGRLDTIPTVTYEMKEDYTFEAMGAPSSVQLTEVAKRVEDLLTDDWQTTKDIRDSLGDPQPSDEQTRKALTLLLESGKVERDPKEDRKGARYKWKAAFYKPPTTPPVLMGSEVTQPPTTNLQPPTESLEVSDVEEVFASAIEQKPPVYN